MQQDYTLDAGNPRQIVDLRFQAQYVSVVNLTASVLYARVGGRDFPDARNYDFMVPAAAARVFPVTGKDFALALSAGAVGAVGGVTGFTAACEVIFIRDEYPPTMSGFDLPPSTQSKAGTFAAGQSLQQVIDARGFNSLYLEMTADTSKTISPFGWLIETGATEAGPWAIVQAFRTFDTNQQPIIRQIPVGAGFIRVTCYNRYPIGGVPGGASIVWRPQREAVNPQVRRTVTQTVTFDKSPMFYDNEYQLINWTEFGGRVVGFGVNVRGWGGGVQPAVMLKVITDEFGQSPAKFLLGQVTPRNQAEGIVHLAGGEPYLLDGDASSRYWYLPLDIQALRKLQVNVTNMSEPGGNITEAQFSLVIEYDA